MFVGWGKLDVLIDINIQSPVELSKEQPLPESVQSLYTGEAEFAILDYTLNLPKIDTILTNYCQKAKDQSTEFVRDIIFSTKVECVSKESNPACLVKQSYTHPRPLRCRQDSGCRHHSVKLDEGNLQHSKDHYLCTVKHSS